VNVFAASARKAQVGALIAFIGPLLTYVLAEGDWSWRAFVGSVLSGVVAGGSVYATTNAPAVPPGRHEGNGNA
jgi:Na+/H+-translocating membrane pyrophosphatase